VGQPASPRASANDASPAKKILFFFIQKLLNSIPGIRETHFPVYWYPVCPATGPV
jgi:hypothetical protein